MTLVFATKQANVFFPHPLLSPPRLLPRDLWHRCESRLRRRAALTHVPPSHTPKQRPHARLSAVQPSATDRLFSQQAVPSRTECFCHQNPRDAVVQWSQPENASVCQAEAACREWLLDVRAAALLRVLQIQATGGMSPSACRHVRREGKLAVQSCATRVSVRVLERKCSPAWWRKHGRGERSRGVYIRREGELPGLDHQRAGDRRHACDEWPDEATFSRACTVKRASEGGKRRRQAKDGLEQGKRRRGGPSKAENAENTCHLHSSRTGGWGVPARNQQRDRAFSKQHWGTTGRVPDAHLGPPTR